MDQKQLNAVLKEFLVQARERARLSQSEVAARSDVFGMGPVLDQRSVSRIEQQPLSVDAVKVAGYLSAVGMNPSQYYDFLNSLTKPKEDGMLQINSSDLIRSHVESAHSRLENAEKMLNECKCPYISDLQLGKVILSAKSAVQNLNRKPVIGFFGQFDAGKSTLINTILGKTVLPAKYAPATCVVNLVMHESDRPDTIQGQVALFRRGFAPHMIHSKGCVEEHLIESGGFDILDRLGVHNYDDSIPNDAYIATIFVDAPVLDHVWLLDTPGDLNSSDENGESGLSNDSQKALGGAELSDGIVFVSAHIGFLKDTDLGFAANILRGHPPVLPTSPVDHLLFVQSHCHSSISQEDVERVRSVTFKRVKKQLEELVFKEWKSGGNVKESPSSDMLSARTQPFWTENDLYRSQTVGKVQEMITFLVDNQEKVVLQHIGSLLQGVHGKFRSAIAKLESRKRETTDRLREVQEQDARFRRESEKILTEFSAVIESCDSYKDDDQETIRDYFAAKTSVDSLVGAISDLYSDKKEAQAGIGNYIGQLFSAKLESTLKRSGASISSKVDMLLERWGKVVPEFSRTRLVTAGSSIHLDCGSSFDARAAFVGGLAGLGSLGAMALYVSTIASNLGAYILVAKVAGVLVSLGLVGSVTTVTSFVAAIGGPITIGLALASLIGLIVYGLFGSWQKSLAQKVSKALHKSSTLNDMVSTVEKFWDSTKTAIEAGVQELRAQTEMHIQELFDDAKKEYDVEKLEDCIVELDNIVSKISTSK